MSDTPTRFFSHTTEELRVKENTEISMQEAELQLIDCHPSLDNCWQTTVAAGNFSWSRKAVPKSHKVHSLYLKLSAKQPEIDVPLLPRLGLHKLVAGNKGFPQKSFTSSFLGTYYHDRGKGECKKLSWQQADLCLRQSRTNSRVPKSLEFIAQGSLSHFSCPSQGCYNLSVTPSTDLSPAGSSSQSWSHGFI